RKLMDKELRRMGHDPTVCEDGHAAIELLDKNTYDTVITDLRMPEITGWEVVDHLKLVAPETDFLICTAHGDVDDAIRALREGAFDFLPKPLQLFEVSASLQRIAEKRSIANKALALQKRLDSVEGRVEMIGDTPAMAHVKKLIEKIGPSDSAIMILGETGTGKELVAQRIHECSPRRDDPFVAVNCGALPENLVESEFFGHRKGAFTGADVARKGLFEVANGGTLFLDELGELDKSMQVKMLRFLESGEIRRVGENESFHVDVRIVCATNRDLQEMVREGTFREDLFFRVNTFEIHLPPLRERREDIPQLCRHLIARHLKVPSVPPEMISREALDQLLEHHWSGNIRELANVLKHAVVLADGEPIRPEHLPSTVSGQSDPSRAASGSMSSVIKLDSHQAPTLREIEMEVILKVLAKHQGDKPKTAAELGIALKTLYNKLNQYQEKHTSERIAS
ncbi:MAG TPA: sigma-54 dependent transcriptional regulator, partial [Planctomycetaceae bacterium]|nr:sigma-54 dependent transcriptional regulator [Planctomycetaceae bacterium]